MMLSMRLELYKYIDCHCIGESDEFSHRCWKPDDKKSCGTLEILTVGKLKSLKQDIKSRKYCLCLFPLKKKKGLSNQISFTKGLCTKESRSEYKNQKYINKDRRKVAENSLE